MYVLSLTSSPKRLQNIPDLLKRVGTKTFDVIYLNIPNKFGRTGEKYDHVLLKKISKLPKVKINKYGKDLGPASKLFPTLLKTKPGDYIVTVDDDVKYKSTHIKNMLQLAIEKDCVVTGWGRPLKWWDRGSAKWPNKGHVLRFKQVKPFEYKMYRSMKDYLPPAKIEDVELVEGFTGCVYPRKYFPDTSMLKKMILLSKDTYLSDDFVISFYLKVFGFRIISYAQHIKKYIGWSGLIDDYSSQKNKNALHLQDELEGALKYHKSYNQLLNFYGKHKKKINNIVLKSWHAPYDKIFVINMKSKPERKAQALLFLKKLNVPKHKIEILYASTPANNITRGMRQLGFHLKTYADIITKQRMAQLKQNNEGKRRVTVETAVGLSQLRVWKWAQKNKKTVLMMEDDFGPTKEFYDPEAHRMMRLLNWDVFYVGDCGADTRGPNPKTIIKKNGVEIQERYVVCHHALAVRYSATKKIFSKDFVPFKTAINDHLQLYMKKHKLQHYLFGKPLFKQDVIGTKSNIQSAAQLGWEMREGGTKFRGAVIKNISKL